MPALEIRHQDVLGPLINPFDRSERKTLENDLLEGESHNDEFLDFIHDGIDNCFPKPFRQVTIQELTEFRILDAGKHLEKCYLWVIDEMSIKIILELTSNEKRRKARPERPYVCHTNITACKQAYIGGELYFCENGKIYINFASDRYGNPESVDKEDMVVAAMAHMGYNNVEIIRRPEL